MTSSASIGMIPAPAAAQLESQTGYKSDYTTVVRFFIGVNLLFSAVIITGSLFTIMVTIYKTDFVWSGILFVIMMSHLLLLILGRRMWIVTNKNTTKSHQAKIQDLASFKGCSVVILLIELGTAMVLPFILTPPSHFTLDEFFTLIIAPFVFSSSLRIVTIIFACDFEDMVSKVDIDNLTSSGFRYESFQNEIEEDSNSLKVVATEASPSSPPVVTAMIPGSDIDSLRNGLKNDGSKSRTPISPTQKNSQQLSNRIRLRAVESEREYFLKLMNIDLFRKLVIVQTVNSVVIIISQVVLYAIVTIQDYKIVDYSGVGLWGPVLFFFTASYLTWITTKFPSGCSIGTAMGFQIASIFVGFILLVLASISMTQHGMAYYDPEITGRTFCSLMILAAICECATAFMASIQYCRMTCCARANENDIIILDVETMKM